MGVDVLVVGGGHNGLVAAAYLARAGRRVTVLERRETLGGCVVTEEPWPGFRVSTASYVTSLFHPGIVADLQLGRHGYEVLPRDPSSFTPMDDGRSLTFWADERKTCAQIAAFNRDDAERWPAYQSWLATMADTVEPLTEETPPNLPPRGVREIAGALRLAWRHRRAAAHLDELVDLFSLPATSILDRWFRSDELKATLATDGIIGAFAGPRTPGTAYVLLHHVMGQTGGRRGVWAYVRGGMGGLSRALAGAAREKGAVLRTGVAVASIVVRAGAAVGVVLEDGETIEAPVVLSGVDPHTTFLRLVGSEHLPEAFARRIAQLDYSSASLKINLALGELPRFTACPHAGREPAPHHRGTIHICGSVDAIERAFDDAKYGRPSTEPVLECTLPSALDDSLAPPGQHVLNIFAQYAPYDLAQGSWDEVKESFADRCIERLARYAPNVPAAILHRQVVSPVDLERTFGLYRGNIFHGAMTPSQMFSLRPVSGWARYRTPVRGLYLGGSGAHPGGGVMGLPGRNAARAVITDNI